MENLFKKYYMTDAVKVDEHKLTALSCGVSERWRIFICTEKCQVKEPIQAVYIFDDQEAAMFNHVMIVADDNSSVTYVENYISTRRRSKWDCEYRF